MTKRLPYFCNLAFILIALIIVGNVLEPVTDYSFAVRIIWRWINLFHMPALIFVGGMFAKRLYTKQQGLNANAIAYYLILFLLLYGSLYAWQYLYGAHPAFEPFSVESIPWLLLVMAILGASTPILHRLANAWKLLLAVSIIASVMAPFCPEYGDFLCFGRAISYAPFYFLGYYLNIDTFCNKLADLHNNKTAVIVSTIALAAVLVALYCIPNGWSAALSRISTGHYSFDAVASSFDIRFDAVLKVLAYALSSVMSFALFVLVPSRETRISSFGTRAMQVFFLHPFVLYPLGYFEVYKPLLDANAIIRILILLVFAITLSIILSIPKKPTEYLNALKRKIDVDKIGELENHIEQKGFDLSLVSKYRAQLYGLAILWVMIFHGAAIAKIDYSFGFSKLELLKEIIGMGNVGVDIFLFLSGISLFFSLSKNPSIKAFYRKRIVRLAIPVWVIDGMYWLFKYIILPQGGPKLEAFANRMAMMQFWISGDETIWFVSLILLLYVAFPFIYKFVYENKFLSKPLAMMAAILAAYAIPLSVSVLMPEWYSSVEIALTRIPIFVIGCCFGESVFKARKTSWAFPLALAFIAILFLIITWGPNAISKMPLRFIYGYEGIALSFILAFTFDCASRHNSNWDASLPNKLLVFAGSASLELYVAHIAINQILRTQSWYSRHVTWSYACVIVLSLIAAAVVERISKAASKRIR